MHHNSYIELHILGMKIFSIIILTKSSGSITIIMIDYEQKFCQTCIRKLMFGKYDILLVLV